MKFVKNNLHLLFLVLAFLSLFWGMGSGCDSVGTSSSTTNITVTTTGSGVTTTTIDGATFTYVTGTGEYSVPTVSMPAKGSSVTDAVFHTTIIRITDKTNDGYSVSAAENGIENEYARTDPENCDGSRIVLRGNDGNWYLYDASNFTMLRQLASIVGGGEEPEPRWDPSNPKVFYYLYATELRSYNIDLADASASTTIHDFKNDFPSAAYITTKTEGDSSLDRRYWSFMVEGSSYNLIAVIVYDKTINSILGQKNAATLPSGVGLNWVSMDMSGDICVLGYEDAGLGSTPPIDTYTRTFSHVATLPVGSTGHMDLALDKNGKDVMIYQNNATDYIAMADLNTGAETNLVFIPFNINGDIGLHFSGNCSQAPGWVLVSTYGSKDPPPSQVHSWMDEQVYMVELKANPRIWRVANTHAYTSLAYSGQKNYFAECFAAINTKGTKIYFGSNWETYTPDGYSETYQIVLPNHWENYVP